MPGQPKKVQGGHPATKLVAKYASHEGDRGKSGMEVVSGSLPDTTNVEKDCYEQYCPEMWELWKEWLSSAKDLQPTTVIENQVYNRSNTANPNNTKRELAGLLEPKTLDKHPRIQSLEAPSVSKGLSNEVGLPDDSANLPSEPQPGIIYLACWSRSEYIPAVVLFPGRSQGPFSIENTEHLGLLETCCCYDPASNTKTCSKDPGSFYPILYFDKEEPKYREVGWELARFLKPLHSGILVPVPYQGMISQYIQKHGSNRNGTRTRAPMAQMSSVKLRERGLAYRRRPTEEGGSLSGGAPTELTGVEKDARMAISRLVHEKT